MKSETLSYTQHRVQPSYTQQWGLTIVHTARWRANPPQSDAMDTRKLNTIEDQGPARVHAVCSYTQFADIPPRSVHGIKSAVTLMSRSSLSLVSHPGC